MEHDFENETPEVQGNQTENTENTYGNTDEGAVYSKPYVDSANCDPNAGDAYTNPHVDSTNDDRNVNAGGPYSDPNAGATYIGSTAGVAYNNPNAGASYTYGSPVNKQEERAATGQDTAQNYSYGNTGAGQPQGNSNYNTYNNPNNQGTGNATDGFDNAPLSMGEFLLIDIVALIPCVGIIVYLIWAFGNSGNINRRNFCRAHLIVTAVAFVIEIILVIIMVSAFASAMPYMY